MRDGIDLTGLAGLIGNLLTSAPSVTCPIAGPDLTFSAPQSDPSDSPAACAFASWACYVKNNTYCYSISMALLQWLKADIDLMVDIDLTQDDRLQCTTATRSACRMC